MGSSSSRSNIKSSKVHPNLHVHFEATELPPSSSSNKYKEETKQSSILERRKTSLTFSNDDEYDGETLDDGVTFDGFGKYTFSGGDSYEGVIDKFFISLYTFD